MESEASAMTETEPKFRNWRNIPWHGRAIYAVVAWLSSHVEAFAEALVWGVATAMTTRWSRHTDRRTRGNEMNKPTEEIPPELITEDGDKLCIKLDNLAESTEYSVEIGSEFWKHDITWYTAVLLYKGEFYRYAYKASYDHGAL